MTGPETHKDSTRIRTPSQGVKKIPEKFNASIVIIKGHAAGMEYPLKKNYTVLGRDRTADIAVKDAQVSRQHVAIMYENGEFILKDLESTNGTIVNGALIEQARIHHRDTFQIGETTIQFILENTDGSRTYEVADEE